MYRKMKVTEHDKVKRENKRIAEYGGILKIKHVVYLELCLQHLIFPAFCNIKRGIT